MTACGEKTSTTITLVTNFGTIEHGAKVTLTNHSGDKSHVYTQTAHGTSVDFRKIVPGSYTLTIEGDDVFTFTQSDITVHSTVAGFTVNLFKKGQGGGYVFYDKGSVSDGWRYLEAAPANTEFNAEWGAYTIQDGIYYGVAVRGTQTGIGTGKANTQIINAMLSQLGETGRAAQLCSALYINGFNDWFLPSQDELYIMYENLHKKGLGDFGKGTGREDWMNWAYWSSSQNPYDSYSALNQFFIDGGGWDTKWMANRVRAVRAFAGTETISAIQTDTPVNSNTSDTGRYKIGDIGSGGGYIFYDKGYVSDGWRYIVAAPPNTEFEADWNTAINRCKELKINDITGWSLPDKDQLNLMYENLHKNGIGGFQNDWYWSSSRHTDYDLDAWNQDFRDGSQDHYSAFNTGNQFRVRAVLAF